MKEFLKTLGIEGENAEKIIAHHDEIIAKSYVPLSRFNEVNTELKAGRESIKSLNTQIEDLKKVDPKELQATIERLQGENKAAADKFKADIAAMKLNNAVERAVGAAGAKNIKAVLPFLDSAKLKLDGDNLSGFDEQVKALKEDAATAFLFKSEDASDKGDGIKGLNPDGRGKDAADVGGIGAKYAAAYNSRMGVGNTNV